MYRERSKWRLWGASVVCVLVAALLVVGCGSSDESSQSTAGGGTETTADAKLKSILLVNPLPDNPQWRLLGDEIKNAGEKLGIEVTESAPTKAADATQMIELIQQGIANKVGAIITYPASPAFKPILKQAEDAGIVTATLWGGGASATGLTNVGADFTDMGKVYVDALVDRSGPQKVGLIAYDPTGTGKAWMDGFEAAAADAGNITVEGVVYTADDPARALSQANALLAAHPDINVVASHMGTATTPTVSAIKGKGLKGRVIMLANGAVAGGLEGAREGVVEKFLLQDLAGASRSVVQAVADIAAGKDVPAQIDVPGTMVGLDDYEEYSARGWS